MINIKNNKLPFAKLFSIGILSLISANTVNATPITNVALWKTVAVNTGSFFSSPVAAVMGDALISNYSTLTDSLLFEDTHQWNRGTVWWHESADDVQNEITVFLGDKSCKVTRLTLQVDSNDDYKVNWIDAKSGLSYSASVQPITSDGLVKVTIPVKAYTKAFTISHDENGRGDDLYAISEFSAIGTCK